MKKHIPNLFTLLNLASGCVGIVLVFRNDIRLACFTILISLILDYMDGMAARLLDVKSDLGKELDSLADLVSFGVLPGVMVYMILENISPSPWSFAAFLIPVSSAYRLAKFNLDTRQTVNFIGLPTPANAIFWSSLPLILFSTNGVDKLPYLEGILSNYNVLMIAILVSAFLLNAPITLFSLKFKDFNLKNNFARFLFLVVSLILFLVFSIQSIPIIIILYLIISIIFHQHIKKYEVQS